MVSLDHLEKVARKLDFDYVGFKDSLDLEEINKEATELVASSREEFWNRIIEANRERKSPESQEQLEEQLDALMHYKIKDEAEDLIKQILSGALESRINFSDFGYVNGSTHLQPSSVGKSVITISDNPSEFGLYSQAYSEQTRLSGNESPEEFYDFFGNADIYHDDYPIHADMRIPENSLVIGGCHFAIDSRGKMIFGYTSIGFGSASKIIIEKCLSDNSSSRIYQESYIDQSSLPEYMSGVLIDLITKERDEYDDMSF